MYRASLKVTTLNNLIIFRIVLMHNILALKIPASLHGRSSITKGQILGYRTRGIRLQLTIIY